MNNLIEDVVLLATLTAFAYFLLHKWGVIEYLQIHSPNRLIHELLQCSFCKCFWLTFIISIAYALLTNDYKILFYPAIVTPIANRLI
jgi:hypothetical protein